MSSPDHSTRISGGFRAAILGASAGAAAAALNRVPGFEIHVLAQAAARLAGVLVGSGVTAVTNGYALPHGGVPVVVTTACSAADFTCLVAALMGWRLGRSGRPAWQGLLIAIGAAVPVTVVVNAVRIAALCRVHQWVIPRLPPDYGAFVHLATGVAVFLPALIALNLALQAHDHRHAVRSR